MSTAGKPITCGAAVTWGTNKNWSIETVEVAAPKDGEVRIKMSAAGLCHTDLFMMEGNCKSRFQFPVIFGHEGSGFVESVGKDVTSVNTGDLVVLVSFAYCGECDLCKHPKSINCRKQTRNNLQMDGTSRITCKGQSVGQMNTISTFSEYTVTSELNVTKVNPKVDPKTVCVAGCCLPTGYGAVVKKAQIPPGSTCAVWGLGGIGMCVVMGCRDSGASKIIGLDTNSKKFELAKEFGCTDFINPHEVTSVKEKIEQMTGEGVDFCFVSVGSIPVMEEAFMCSHSFWGKTILIGLTDEGETMKAGIWELLYGRKLCGTIYGSYKARKDIPHLVDKMVNGQLQMEKLISHRLPLHRINEGFDFLRTGEAMRAIIDFDLES